MTESEVIKNIKMLAQSQGFYGRLLENLEEAKGTIEYEEFIDGLKDCKDAVDMVMKIEG